MVKKSTTKKAATAGRKAGAKKAAGPKRGDISSQVIAAALGLAEQHAWRDLSLAEIAEAAGLPLSQVYPLFPSKQAILEAFADGIDAAMVAEPGERLDSPARDRLFDVVMRRFDALAPYKAALAAILQSQACDPLALCCGLSRLGRSMAATLEAAGFSTSGCRGMLRVKGLAAVYLSTLRVWLRDDSEDMARTMAHLDKQLARVDGLVGRLSGFRSRRAAA
jgi:AcrR family transcriptional regulator